MTYGTRLLCGSSIVAEIGLTCLAAHGKVISLTDQSLAPDGSTTILTDYVNINTLNDNANVLASSVSTAYIVTTFTWGASSDAHLAVRFNFDAPGDANNRARIGFQVEDTGVVSTIGTSAGFIDYDALTNQPERTTFDLAQDMAGKTVVLLAKLYYNSNNSVTYNARATIAGSQNSSDDTLMNVWVNPTGSDVEGSGPTAGDLYALANSANFKGFKQIIENQSTPGTAGTSFVTNTTILTGTDATFADALAIAVPEPASLAVMGLGGLVLAKRRRR